MAPTPTVTADSARSPRSGSSCPWPPARPSRQGDLAPLSPGGATLLLAIRAEDLGFDSLWLSDHFLMTFG